MKYFLNPKDQQVFAYEDSVPAAKINPDLVPITEDEAKTRTNPPVKAQVLNYKEQRAAEYPPMADQLDMLYHDKVNGTNTWQEAITAVKDKIPKTDAVAPTQLIGRIM